MGFTDTFTNTNLTLLSDHVGDNGQEYDAHPSSTGSPRINANRLRGNGADVSTFVATLTPSSNEFDLQFDLVILSTINQDATGVVARAHATANTMYRAYAYGDGSKVRLDKVVSGATTLLGEYAPSPLLNSTIKFEVKDATKKIFISGVERISSSDNTISAAGKVGTLTRFSAATTGYHLDNLLLTDSGGSSVSGTVAFSQDASLNADNRAHSRLTATQDASLSSATKALSELLFSQDSDILLTNRANSRMNVTQGATLDSSSIALLRLPFSQGATASFVRELAGNVLSASLALSQDAMLATKARALSRHALTQDIALSLRSTAGGVVILQGGASIAVRSVAKIVAQYSQDMSLSLVHRLQAFLQLALSQDSSISFTAFMLDDVGTPGIASVSISVIGQVATVTITTLDGMGATTKEIIT